MKITLESLKKNWKKYRVDFKTTIIDNPYIPHKPFLNQVHFLTHPSEELIYGGQAGGGKSDALLMSALQYVSEPDYSALILRKTYPDLSKPNAIMDRANRWLSPHEELHWTRDTKTWQFPSGATLSFGYLAHNNDLDQYQGAEFQFVGFDELTQFSENQYKYLHSRLRKLEDSEVPIRMRAGTNPGGRGHDWVKKRFIKEDSPLPFIPSSYLDNIFLDREQYGHQLDKLDGLIKLQLKYGDWNAVLEKGLLITREELDKSKISYENTYKSWQPAFCTIGIDPASTGSDKFAMSCLVYFNNGKIILVDLDSTTSTHPEERLKNFVIRNLKWNPYVIDFEQEPGSDSAYALKYWETVLNELIYKNGIILKNTPPSKSKYNRAMPTANLIRQGRLFFDDRIEEGKLRNLFNQYIYIHPDKEIMKNHPSPDELDSVWYAFSEIQNVVIL